MPKMNLIFRSRINTLRDSQNMWGSTRIQLSDQIYSVSLLREFYKAVVANLGPYLEGDGVVTPSERDELINNSLGQVLPVDNPNTAIDESVSPGEFMEFHDKFLDPDGQLLWLDNVDIQNPNEILDRHLADLDTEIRKLVGLQGLTQDEMDAIVGQIARIEVLMDSEQTGD